MDPATQSYFAEVAGLLESVTGTEEFEALCSSALSEVVGGAHTYALLCDLQGCRTLQGLLESQAASPEVALQLLTTCLKAAPAPHSKHHGDQRHLNVTGGSMKTANKAAGKPREGNKPGGQRGQLAQQGEEEAPLFSDLFTMPGPSWVLEKCFALIGGDSAPTDLEPKAYPAQVVATMIKILGAIKRSLLHIVSSPCGSHVLRSLLSLLSGSSQQVPPHSHEHPPAKQSQRGNFQAAAAESNPGLNALLQGLAMATRGWAQKGEPSRQLQAPAEDTDHGGKGALGGWRGSHEMLSLAVDLSVDLVKAGSSMAAGGTISDSGVQSLCCNAAASPAMQAALRVLPQDPPRVHLLLLHVLMPLHMRKQLKGASSSSQKEASWEVPEKELTKAWRAVDVENVAAVVMDRAGSRFMEAAVRAAPSEWMVHLFKFALKGRLRELALHPFGNFVVQALLQVLPTKRMLKAVVGELQEEFLPLLSQGRGGVVAALLLSCSRLKCFQARVCTLLLDASRSLDPSAGACGPSAIKAALTQAVEGSAQNGSHSLLPPPGPVWGLLWLAGSNRSSLVGCLLVQTMLTFPGKCIEPVLSEVSSWPRDKLATAGQDPRASRVLEFVLMSPSVTQSCKAHILKKLQGHYGQLARSPVGCHVVEKAYTVAGNTRDMEAQEVIVAEVSRAWSSLQRMPAGMRLSELLRLAQYRQSPHEWRTADARRESLLAEFADLVGGPLEGGKLHEPVKEGCGGLLRDPALEVVRDGTEAQVRESSLSGRSNRLHSTARKKRKLGEDEAKRRRHGGVVTGPKRTMKPFQTMNALGDQKPNMEEALALLGFGT